MKKLTYLLLPLLLLTSCKAAAVALGKNALRLSGNENGKIFLAILIYELFSTGLPIVIAMYQMMSGQQDSANEDDVFKFAGYMTVISIITYYVNEDLEGILSLGLLALIPIVAGFYFKLSPGRAFGVLGLAILYSLIVELIAVAIFS